MGLALPTVSGVVKTAAHNGIQWNAALGVEAMKQAQGGAATVAHEGFSTDKASLLNLGKTVRKPATFQSDGQVRSRAQGVLDAQLRIQKNRGDGHAESEVVALECARFVEIIKSVTRNGAASFERLVIAQLKQLAVDGINLCLCEGNTCRQACQPYPYPPSQEKAHGLP